MVAPFGWTCLFLTFLLNGCLVPVFCKPPGEDRINDFLRERVVAVAKNDPCSQGLWSFRIAEDKAAAKKGCEGAYNNFVYLDSEEQAACPDAAMPDCKPLSGCSNIYSCTFMCNIKFKIWRPRSDGAFGYERVFQKEYKERTLHDIVEKMFEKLREAYPHADLGRI